MVTNQGNFKRERLRKGDWIFIITILLLPMLGFAAMYVAVNVRSILMSFQTTIDGVKYSWVGLDNIKKSFVSIFTDVDMKNILGNSFKMWFVGSIVMQGITLFFSYAVWKKMFGAKFFSIILFLPSLLPSVVFSMLGRQAINYAIPAIFGDGLGLLNEQGPGFAIVLGYGCVLGFGSNLVLQLGSMSGVSTDVVEYGRLDGMNSWQEFIHIVFPHIFPTLISLFVMSVPTLFSNYGLLFDFFGEYPSSFVKTFGLEAYSVTLRPNGHLLYCSISATGLILSVFSVALSLCGRRLLERIGPKED